MTEVDSRAAFEIPTSRRLFLFVAGFLLGGALLLRLVPIERRPFHADEGVQAYQTWQLLRGDGYTYDPADKHGPFLYYAAAGIARVSGWSPATLDESHLRRVTLLAGLGTLALLAGLAARLGAWPALIGTALLAVAPLAIIYDTYFVQEAWFSFFTWALLCALLRLRDRPTMPAALLVGLLAGLMQATKETSVLHFAALGLALLATTPPRELARRWPRWLAALGTAVLVYVVFYSGGFTHWTGVIDGLRTYTTYAGRAASSAHNQPWYYYIRMLSPHTREGTHWGEPLLLLAALAGAAFAFSRQASPAHRFVALFTLSLLGIYSVIPYKTPWLLLTPYAGLALLAGLGVVHAAHRIPARFRVVVLMALCLGLLTESLVRERDAVGRYASDDRNPYLYQPTSPQFPRLVNRLNELAARAGRPLRVAVVSPDYAWPLPWYFRAEPSFGFFTVPPAQLSSYDLTLTDSRLPSLPDPAAQPFGLRPDVLLWLGGPATAR